MVKTLHVQYSTLMAVRMVVVSMIWMVPKALYDVFICRC